MGVLMMIKAISSFAILILLGFLSSHQGFAQGVSWTKHIAVDSLLGAHDVFPTDADNDGDTDLFLSGAGIPPLFEPGTVSWAENDGDENFTLHILDSTYTWASMIFGADLNEDNFVDIISTSWLEDDISWWRNDDNQNFSKITISDKLRHACDCYVIDMDADNDPDILGISLYQHIVWWENIDGVLEINHIIDDDYAGGHDIYAADLDGDSDIDIATASINLDEVHWWENDGNQNFEQHLLDGNANG
ncbi:MAG: hypothetical protein GF315_11950, partial [candidate division Zixibacteria bacterium]|nr:hypothetical protein [candidate division Zixibacteria bacterium]